MEKHTMRRADERGNKRSARLLDRVRMRQVSAGVLRPIEFDRSQDLTQIKFWSETPEGVLWTEIAFDLYHNEVARATSRTEKGCFRELERQLALKGYPVQ